MRKLLLSTVIASTLASVSFTGQAAESATLTVTGTITPATCDVSLSSPSISFGNIAASTLTDDVNPKAGGNVTLNVDCDAAAATAIQTTDNRASSAMTGTELNDTMKVTITDLADSNIFGLGTDSAQSKIGVLLLGINAATSDGQANSNLVVSSDKSAWSSQAIVEGSNQILEKNGYFGLASAADATSPAAYTKSTYTISSQMLLKKASLYPSGEAVNLDGNITFSVVYL